MCLTFMFAVEETQYPTHHMNTHANNSVNLTEITMQ